MASLESYRKEGEKLFNRLNLSSYPVAITYIESPDQITNGALQPSVYGKKMSLCQAFTMARQHGTTVAMTYKDNFCTPATAIHRWCDVPLEDLIESQVLQGWHKNRDAEKARFDSITRILGDEHFSAPVKYIGFLCAPISKASFIPDSILVYCDGLQLTHIVQALSYEHQFMPTSSFEGFEESCVKGGLIPFLTHKPQVVIPGAGDRSFAGISAHELGIGFPGDLLFYIMENLFKTGGSMNIGFPQKTLMPMDLNEDLTPGFKYLWDKIT